MVGRISKPGEEPVGHVVEPQGSQGSEHQRPGGEQFEYPVFGFGENVWLEQPGRNKADDHSDIGEE